MLNGLLLLSCVQMLPVKEKVLAQLTYFTEYCDEEVRLKAVGGLGKSI